MKKNNSLRKFILALTWLTSCNFNLAKNTAKSEPKVTFNFESASLKTFLEEVQQIFKVSFIYDDEVKPSQGESKIESKDVKITFRTNQPFEVVQAWVVVDSFLGIAGLSRVPVGSDSKVFRITEAGTATREALPSYIGTNPNELPESGVIRYVYFLRNSSAEQMKQTIGELKSKSGLLNIYPELNALIFTDHAYNIKTLMLVVQELDSTCNPVAISVLKLKEADATEVEKIYNDLKGKSSSQGASYGMPLPKADSQHFLQEATVIAEPRTNTLIIVGPPEANARIEKFISEHIDTKLTKKRSKIHTIELNHIPAEQIAEIFTKITDFGSGGSSGGYGASKEADKYFSKMIFEAEKQSNRLLIRGEEEDFKVVSEIIKGMDKAQPQVAMEVLIVNLISTSDKGTSSQLNNKKSGPVNFQTSGFGGSGSSDTGSGIQLSSDNSLVTNLISLATSSQVGSTVISLGKNSVWALLSVLNQDSKTNVLSNPFLVTTNKYPASTSLGQTRRIDTGTVQGSTNSQAEKGDAEANLSVKITPRINSIDLINLDIDIIIEEFTSSESNNGNKSVKTLHTNATIANGEVLVLGGLSKDSNKASNGGVPLLSKIPILGSLFKSKSQTLSKENLIIFITPKVIRPEHNLGNYTKNKADYITDIMQEIDRQDRPRDPIARWVFQNKTKQETEIIDQFMAKDDFANKSEQRNRKQISSAIMTGPEVTA